jgi:copper(I)-binding protein
MGLTRSRIWLRDKVKLNLRATRVRVSCRPRERDHYAVPRLSMIEEDIVTASRSSRRARLCAALVTGAVALVVGPALASCSAGQITQTSAQVAAVPGANANVGSVALRDLLIAYNGREGYTQGGSAPLIVHIANDGQNPVTLVTATADAAAEKVLLVGAAATSAPTATATPSAAASASPSRPASPSPSAASPSATATPRTTPSARAEPGQETFSIVVAPKGFVQLVPGKGPYLQLTGLKRPLIPGQSVPVTFRFSDGSSATVDIPFAPPPSELPRESPVAPEEDEQTHAAAAY